MGADVTELVKRHLEKSPGKAIRFDGFVVDLSDIPPGAEVISAHLDAKTSLRLKDGTALDKGRNGS